MFRFLQWSWGSISFFRLRSPWHCNQTRAARTLDQVRRLKVIQHQRPSHHTSLCYHHKYIIDINELSQTRSTLILITLVDSPVGEDHNLAVILCPSSYEYTIHDGCILVVVYVTLHLFAEPYLRQSTTALVRKAPSQTHLSSYTIASFQPQQHPINHTTSYVPII